MKARELRSSFRSPENISGACAHSVIEYTELMYLYKFMNAKAQNHAGIDVELQDIT